MQQAFSEHLYQEIFSFTNQGQEGEGWRFAEKTMRLLMNKHMYEFVYTDRPTCGRAKRRSDTAVSALS